MNQAEVNNFLLIKAVEDESQEIASKVIGFEALDRKELASVLECSIMGKIINKTTNEPLKLSNETMIKGLQNLMLQNLNDYQKEI